MKFTVLDEDEISEVTSEEVALGLTRSLSDPPTREESLAARYAVRASQLTTQERVFVAAFVRSSNRRQSALEAGYSEGHATTAASNLLLKPRIQNAIRDMQERMCRKYELKAERVVHELRCIAFVNMADFTEVEHDAEGNPVRRYVDINSISRDNMAAISELYYDRNGLRVKFADKSAALAQLARILGLIDADGPMKTFDDPAEKAPVFQVNFIKPKPTDESGS